MVDIYAKVKLRDCLSIAKQHNINYFMCGKVVHKYRALNYTFL